MADPDKWRLSPPLKNTLFFSLFFITFCSNSVEPKYVKGTIKSKEDWEFIARFCFLSEQGSLKFKFSYPVDYGVQNILLYFDDADQWPSVYKTPKNCWQKEAVLKPENNQIIELSKDYQWSGCDIINATSSTALYSCEGGRSFRSFRQRWWFVAVSNCAGTKGVGLDYELWLTNGAQEELFKYQFSADEFYILEVDIAFCCVFAFMLSLSIYVAHVLQQRQLFHTTYKMYMISIIFEVLHMFLMCVGYGTFANSGEQSALDSFKLIARICESISILTFLLMLILMAKGFTITRGRLSQSGSVKIAIFITIYVIVYAILFIYEAVFFDPGLVLYLYESPAGYGLIALRLLGWIWFCYATFFTLKHYPEKASFYYPFFIFYTLWFLSTPITAIINTFAVPGWMRAKVANGVQVYESFLAHSIFLILTRPSAANSNFPYHVRTSQIGVMSSPPNGGIPMTASTNPDSFIAHSYAPSKPPPYSENDQSDEGATNQRFTDIFTVSNQRSASRNGTNGSVNIDKFPHHQNSGFQPA